jgi:hypothetical protein
VLQTFITTTGQALTRALGFDGDRSMDTSFYSLTAEIKRIFFNAFAIVVDRDEELVTADQADLMVVLLFVAIGILLTAAFVMLGFGPEIGQILGAAG